MKYARRIQQAGFRLTVEDGRLLVEPFSRLSSDQIAFMQRHKAEIIAELQAANADTAGAFTDSTLMEILARACGGLDLTVDDMWRRLDQEDIEAIHQNPEAEWPAVRTFAKSLSGHAKPSRAAESEGKVICHTPAGGRIAIEPDSREHAEWLRRMNPKPKD